MPLSSVMLRDDPDSMRIQWAPGQLLRIPFTTANFETHKFHEILEKNERADLLGLRENGGHFRK